MPIKKAKSKKRASRIPISKIVLSTLAVGGLVAVAIMAPNAVQALKLFGYGKKRQDPRSQVNRSLGYLKENGYIIFQEKNGGKFIRLTPKGKKKLEQYQNHEVKFKKPKQWDGKWRLVIFDIKERKRSVRDKLRAELQNIGFVRLQNSVWMFPYDCREFVIMLKADSQIGKDVLYITADTIENDKYFRSFFKLNKK